MLWQFSIDLFLCALAIQKVLKTAFFGNKREKKEEILKQKRNSNFFEKKFEFLFCLSYFKKVFLNFVLNCMTPFCKKKGSSKTLKNAFQKCLNFYVNAYTRRIK
jgi:hypothetical protein